MWRFLSFFLYIQILPASLEVTPLKGRSIKCADTSLLILQQMQSTHRRILILDR